MGPLRELPPEADCIDAVRLMSIHGSKGLELARAPIDTAADFACALPRQQSASC
jgi:hypothetical protein